jgi:serine/threonine protein kinase
VGAAPIGDSVGRYELLIELAKGGMAELYVGRLHGVGGFAKLVAIKRILPHLAEDKLFAEMFLNEGRIASRLAHANICQVHELGEADGDLFLAMEYLDGVPWSELAKKLPRDTTTLRLAAGVLAQACDGLHYAHELRDLDGNPTPVVHRDVSPQNLFVTTDGTCKVLDFGIAKMLEDGPRTRTGVLKGKLPYMSPEQIQGEEVDARSDVFALGVVLWEALTGTSLFDRETDFLIWKAITEAPIPPLAPFGFPPSIDAVIGAALARDKKLRFRSARALGEALRNAVEPVGGAFDAGEIADFVRLRCGAKLAVRQREIASAVTRRSKPTLEPTAADTIEDKAGSTTDLKPMHTGAGSTVRLRSDAKAVERRGPDADATIPPTRQREPDPDATIPPTRKRAPDPESTIPPTRKRSRDADSRSDSSVSRSSFDNPRSRSKAPWIIAGGLVLAGVIVAVAVTRSPDAPPAVSSAAPASDDSSENVTDVGTSLEEAGKAIEAVTGDGRLGKAIGSLESLAKWGQRMEGVRDSIHGTDETDATSDESDGSDGSSAPTSAASDESDESSAAGSDATKAGGSKPSDSKSSDSKLGDSKPSASKSDGPKSGSSRFASSTSSDSKSGTSTPSGAKPEHSTSSDAKPGSTKSNDSKPGDSKSTGRNAAVGEGLLSVDSSPFAVIYLDGNRLGETPFFNQRVSAGKHELRAVLDDGRSQKRTVTIEAGKATNLGKLAWPKPEEPM